MTAEKTKLMVKKLLKNQSLELFNNICSNIIFQQVIDYSDHHTGLSCITDTRSVDELLMFINGDPEQKSAQNVENKASSKAAKRQRQKQKKVRLHRSRAFLGRILSWN